MSCGWNVSTSGMFVCSWGGQVELFHGAFPPTGTGRATFHRREVDKVLCVRVLGLVTHLAAPSRTAVRENSWRTFVDP